MEVPAYDEHGGYKLGVWGVGIGIAFSGADEELCSGCG